MQLQLIRYHTGDDATLGSLFHAPPGGVVSWLCYTLEDEHREKKVMHETRIPAGNYRLDLRRDPSPMNTRYAKSFPRFHNGMIWLRWRHDGGDLGYREDWGWTWVYLHVGNTDDHTSGCILTAFSSHAQTFTVSRSRDAYRAVYQLIAGAIANGETTELQIIDYA